ncbi:hypothetical protein C0J52_04749 [Blattella germanica]|nr:hypothetical protein C0J52_04749 [Blattella germanica]
MRKVILSFDSLYSLYIRNNTISYSIQVMVTFLCTELVIGSMDREESNYVSQLEGSNLPFQLSYHLGIGFWIFFGIMWMSAVSTFGLAITATRAFPSLVRQQNKWFGVIFGIIFISLFIIFNEISYNYVHMKTAIVFE